MFARSQTTEADVEQLLADLPGELPILALRNIVAMPFAVVPLAVGIPRSIRLIEEAVQGNRVIGLLSMVSPEIDEPGPEHLYQVGTVAMLHKVVRVADGTLQVVVQGLERMVVEEWTQTEPYLKARVRVEDDINEPGVESEAYHRSLVQVAREVAALTPNLPEGVGAFIEQMEDSRQLAYMIVGNSRMTVAEQQAVLEARDVNEKMRLLIAHLSHEREVLSLGRKITAEAQEEMSRAQREYFLRQQLDAIRKELGEGSEAGAEAAEYRRRLDAAMLPEEARKEAERELRRLEQMPPQAAEYGTIKTYLDWLLDLPWNTRSADNLDIAHAREVLDTDHYDMQEVKSRLLEYLAVRKLVHERGSVESDDSSEHNPQGAILCLVGPPGVGKTSLGQSIARAMGRAFTRMSLGGMRDEAEIRGHRRTYIGAIPGRIIQAIKRAGSRNPVFMLDEIDKVGSDWRGDPSSALLEVLDPQQNRAFRDHYLDLDFDLSEVMFICTANTLETIPPPLRDRMEIIELDGYTEGEKLQIARDFLVPRQRRANGLRNDEIMFEDDALLKVIREYTRESGVRNLERQIGTVARKAAVEIAEASSSIVPVAEGETAPPHVIQVTEQRVRSYLGRQKVFHDAALRTELTGVATGLAWTPVGGDVLFIEATRMPGKGGLTITGQLGKVMEESARIAFSYVQARAVELGVEPQIFEQSSFHIHVPEGAMPKDGPSAGVTMVTALVSLLTGHPVRADVGMTGETTLRGQVLPIGGLKQKVLAAHRAGLSTVILPQRNEQDLDELPEDVRATMTFVPVERIDQVLAAALRTSGAGQEPIRLVA